MATPSGARSTENGGTSSNATLPPNGTAENITVIGAGRLGLCWALAVEQAGYVKAVDVFPTYIEAINKRTLRSTEPHVMEMLSKAQNLTACLSVAEGAAFSDYIYIFVQGAFDGRRSPLATTRT